VISFQNVINDVWWYRTWTVTPLMFKEYCMQSHCFLLSFKLITGTLHSWLVLLARFCNQVPFNLWFWCGRVVTWAPSWISLRGVEWPSPLKILSHISPTDMFCGGALIVHPAADFIRPHFGHQGQGRFGRQVAHWYRVFACTGVTISAALPNTGP